MPNGKVRNARKFDSMDPIANPGSYFYKDEQPQRRLTIKQYQKMAKDSWEKNMQYKIERQPIKLKQSTSLIKINNQEMSNESSSLEFQMKLP